MIEHFAVPVEKRFLLVVKDTDVHGPGMKVDYAVIPVLLGVESHWTSAYATATARQAFLWLKMVDVAIPTLLHHGRRP